MSWDFPVNEENAKKFASVEKWGFEPPSWKGLSAAHMVLAADRGEIDALWQSGGNFKSTLPEPEMVNRALGKIKLRIHQDIVANPTMFVEPADTVVLLPSRTRYEQRGGGTETSTERRDHLQSRDSRAASRRHSRRMGDPGDGGPQIRSRARRVAAFPWRDTQDIRNEIDRVCPTYKGIAKLQKKGDQFQYGGPRLLVDRCLTPDGLGHFSAVALPEESVPPGRFLLATRRGKQFNSILLADKDPITGASRDDIIMSAEDAERMGLKNGDAITLRNEHGSFSGRVRIDRIKPGCLQAHWPEINVIIPAGRLDPSGVPDYNATVEVVGGSCLQARSRTRSTIAASIGRRLATLPGTGG